MRDIRNVEITPGCRVVALYNTYSKRIRVKEGEVISLTPSMVKIRLDSGEIVHKHSFRLIVM